MREPESPGPASNGNLPGRGGPSWSEVPRAKDPPDFNQLLAVLSRSRPARPTLFEFFLNGTLHARLAGELPPCPEDLRPYIQAIQAFRNAGYDSVSFVLPGFSFPSGEVRRGASVSLNEGGVIRDRASFDAYPWPDPARADYGLLDRLLPAIPPGMKLLVHGPRGVLENVVKLVGYETLCLLSVDDEALVSDLFEAVGSRLSAYYERAARHPAVGAVIGNDDWGFRSQTLLPPDRMRRWVFPWHARIAGGAHAAGKPAILHSCGRLDEVLEDVAGTLRYDAKHSYEDAILPVEEAYERDHARLAVLGGIDVDFVCRAAPEAVYERARAMLQRTERRGGYALGTGNSVPEYVPHDRYFALVRAALDLR